MGRKNRKVICGIAATKSYLGTLDSCLRRVDAAANHAKDRCDVEVVICTDKESWQKVHGILSDRYQSDLTSRKFEVLYVEMTESGANYSSERQILIANLQTQLFDYARLKGCDWFWMVEADVLVPHNAITCSLDMLSFDDGYYDVAFVTYPCQSGGSFLGGNGTPQNQIAQDFLVEEREIPDDVLSELKGLEEELDHAKDALDANKPDSPDQDTEERREKHEELLYAYEDAAKSVHDFKKGLEEFPPKDSVFALNAKQWRARGWLDNAYPAIGRGTVLPTDWTGLGCIMLTQKALNCSHFDGYEGGGTQDLFLNWHRWYPEGMKFCLITHTVCEHVMNDKGELCFAYHETEGEMKGHLRRRNVKYYKFNGNDEFDPKDEKSPRKEEEK